MKGIKTMIAILLISMVILIVAFWNDLDFESISSFIFIGIGATFIILLNEKVLKSNK